jgi:hypothetical protein
MPHSSSKTAASSHIPNCYETCTTAGGVYDQLIEKLSELGNLTLGGADYRKDFDRRITDRGNYKYVHRDDLHDHENSPGCHFIIFGQTCPMALGTQLSSRGSNTNYKVCMYDNRIQVTLPISSTRTRKFVMTPSSNTALSLHPHPFWMNIYRYCTGIN